MITKDADLIVRMVDFTKPGVGTNQYMSKESFINNVINNDYAKQRLKSGMLKCLLTHQGRDYADKNKGPTPYDDLIATHETMCGVVRDVWVEGDCAYASIDLLDPTAFPAAGKVKDLIKKGTYVGVSMATEAVQGPDGNFEIKELIGCDFTLDNFFIGSGIVTIKKNFSRNGVDHVYMNFLNKRIYNDDHLEMTQRAPDPMNFSLRDVIRESKKPYHLMFAGRVYEAVRILQTLTPELLSSSGQQIMAYVNDPIYNWISNAISGTGRININLGLRINRFLKDQAVANVFNQRANLIKNMYNKMGYLTKVDQNKMQNATTDLINSLWSYIAEKSGVDISLLAGKNTNEKVGLSTLRKTNGQPVTDAQ